MNQRLVVRNYLEKYQQGQWDTSILQPALKQAYASGQSSGWINYLDICHSIQGVTLEQWLTVSHQLQELRSCSPALLLRLRYLMMAADKLSPLSESNRYAYCKALRRLSPYPYAALINDIRTSGYLGCRLTHYPQLLSEVHKGSMPLCSQRFLPGSTSTIVDRKRACDLFSRVRPLHQLIEQAHATTADSKKMTCQHRIAVVGNSPNIKQMQAGEEIDAADIVIRFNNCALSPSNRKHCGIRTDLWVMSPSTSMQNCPTDAKAIVVSGLNALSRPSFYWKKLARCDKLIGEFPARVWHELVSQFQAPPSAGALLLASIEALNPAIDVRYYGFTTLQHDVHSLPNHHTDKTPRSTRHNWHAETDWLANKIAQGKALIVTR